MMEVMVEMGGESMHSSSSNFTYFRSHQMKPPRNRPKCEKIKWDGLPSSFKKFRKEIEGHLLQVGAGYLTNDSFLMMYSKLGKEFLKSDVFWKLHQVSTPQAYTDCQYLFGILMNATALMENKIIIKYQSSKDGIMAWSEFKKEYGFEGSKDLRIEFLESMAQKPYTNSNPGGLSAYIDHFQAHVGELETIVPTEYTDAKKKRLLLLNIREADGVAHLIQKCRDNSSMSYGACAIYLKECAALIDKTNKTKSPRVLMHVKNKYESDHEHEPDTKTVDEVCKIFHTMSKASGFKSAYNTFKSKDFRESLYIPQAIWDELEPSL